MKAKRILSVLLCAALMSALLPPVNAHAATYTYEHYGLTISSDTLAPEYTSVSGGMFTIKPHPSYYHDLTITGSTASDDVTILVGIDANANIKLDNVTMSGRYCPIIVSQGADVGLQLGGVNTLIADGPSPAISVDYGSTLSIRPWQGASYLYAKGGPVRAGINVGRSRWDPDNTYATLNIEGGTVVAVSGLEGSGGTGSAGIGGDNQESGGKINISGGFVVAIGDKAAGIGSGNESEASTKVGGDITISGGTVVAVGGNEGAGIGGGDDDSDGGIINISGGFVTAVGGSYAAGIGGGNNGTSGQITITGGTIIATGGSGGAGIGGGKHNNEDGGLIDSIQIHDGVIFASGNNGGEDIGLGDLTEGTPVDLEHMTGAVAIHAGASDPNPTAVFMRNNALFGNYYNYNWAWVSAAGYTRVGPMNYENISKYGIELSSLIPDGIPAITGTLPDGVTPLNANWIRNLWTAQLNHWLSVTGASAGAILQLKSINYYDLFQGPGELMKQSQHKGTTGQISDGSIASRTGYTFDGWKTSLGGTYNNSTYTFNDGLDLFASWTPNNYTVRYHANNGTTDTVDTTHTYDSAQDLRDNDFTRTGYSFAGWATDPGGNAVYSNRQNVINLAASGVVNLYAAWTPNEYTVRYHANNGTADTVETTHTYDEDKELRDDVFTHTGYDFAGWATNPDGNAVYSSGQTVRNLAASGEVNLYAKWTPTNYTLTYVLNGGTLSSANPASYTIEDTDITLNNPTKTGYIFAGWTQAGVAGDPVMNLTIPAGSTGNRTYNANWTPVIYNLTYELNGGTLSSANPAGYTIESAAITLNNPARTGYDFAGWTQEGVAGDPVMSVTIPAGSMGDRTYTAHWTAIVITGLPDAYTMYTGGRVRWDPKPDGGTWDWDKGYFSAAFNSPATFTALKAGTSNIAYTVNGVSKSIAVTILQAELPQTGQSSAWIWVLVSLAVVCGAAAVFVGIKIRVKAQK